MNTFLMNVMLLPPTPPTPSGPPDNTSMDALLRAHHAAVLMKSVDLDAVPQLMNRAFSFLQEEARVLCDSPLMQHVAHHHVLRHSTLPEALGATLAGKVCHGGSFSGLSTSELESLTASYGATMARVLAKPAVSSAVLADIAKAWIADPACIGLVQPIFFFKGFQAMTTYRVAHELWCEGCPAQQGAALLLQSRMAELFSVDIHPAATIGAGIMLDHASGIVIGSTCVIGNDIYSEQARAEPTRVQLCSSPRLHPFAYPAPCTLAPLLDSNHVHSLHPVPVLFSSTPPTYVPCTLLSPTLPFSPLAHQPPARAPRW